MLLVIILQKSVCSSHYQYDGAFFLMGSFVKSIGVVSVGLRGKKCTYYLKSLTRIIDEDNMELESMVATINLENIKNRNF